VLTVNSQQSTV